MVHKPQHGRGGKREELAYIELLRTADQLTRGVVATLKAEDLTSAQYNVLRVLRGSPEGLPCGEIARRLITREPDVTRLLDRMEKRGLISRCRETADRRTVKTRITEAGFETVNRLETPIYSTHAEQLGHLAQDELSQLTHLLRKARKDT